MEELSLSQINVPVTLKVGDIEIMINDLIDDVLRENVDLTDGSAKDLKIRAEKPENISLSFDSSHINYRVPLKIWIQKIIPITLLEIEVEGAIAISMSTEFKIGPDWKLTTHTYILDHEWLQKPKIKVGLFDLPIKFILNTILDKSKRLICSTIDKELAKNFDLQNIVKDGWETLQGPILIAEEFNLWLNIKPSTVGMTPLISDGEIIKSTLMVQTYASAVMGPKPKEKDKDPLPVFQLKANIEDEFDLNLKTEVAYIEAQKIARKYIVGEEVKLKFFSIKIDDLKLLGKEESIVVDAKLSGTFNGQIVFEGRPVFDKMKNEIKIKDIDYQLVTKNIFYKFFNWLFKGLVKRILKKKLHFQLSENLEVLIKKVGEILVDFEVVDNVMLNGELRKFEIENIRTKEKGIELVTFSSGKLSLFVDKIELVETIEKKTI